MRRAFRRASRAASIVAWRVARSSEAPCSKFHRRTCFKAIQKPRETKNRAHRILGCNKSKRSAEARGLFADPKQRLHCRTINERHMRNIEDDGSRARGKAIRHCAAQSLACIAGAITTALPVPARRERRCSRRPRGSRYPTRRRSTRFGRCRLSRASAAGR